MQDFFEKLFRADFMPHAQCYLWQSDIIWLNVISDSLIALAYYSIPLGLIYFVHRRRDLPFPLLFVMFGAFIVACGSTHLMEVWTVWHGTYRLTGLIKAVTALLSISTAILLIKLMPDALALPSPSELANLNQRLEREITERKGTEENLKMYARVLESMTEGVHLADEQGIIRYTNPACGRMFGYQPGELMGMHVSLLNDCSRAESLKLVAEISEQLRVQGAWFGEMKNRRKNGTPFPTYARITAIQIAGQHFSVSVHEDITTRKQAEEELRTARDRLELRVRERTEQLDKSNKDLQIEIEEHERTEEALYRLASIVESSGDAIIGINLQGIVTSWNTGAEKIFGYLGTEMKGTPILQLSPPDKVEEAKRVLSRICGGERVHHFDTVRLRKDGKPIDVAQTVSAVFDTGGNVVGASIISRDITARKQAEDQIAASLREKEVLLKEIHHRVKNNLQIVSSLLNMQSKFIQDKQALEMFQESRDRIRSMALIHEKLYQSKDLARIDFDAYIRNLVPMMFRSYSARAQSIRLEIEVDPVFLHIDTAVPISFILNEVVSNSLKHAFPNGTGGVVSISFRREGDQQLCLTVRDDGVGVPKDFNLENTSSLGLHLVKLLTEQIGGRLAFHSDGGTEFKVVFSDPEPQPRRIRQGAHAQTTGPAHHEQRHERSTWNEVGKELT